MSLAAMLRKRTHTLFVIGAIITPGAHAMAQYAPNFATQSTSPLNQEIRAVLTRAGTDDGLNDSIGAYYASRGDSPVWIFNGEWTPAAHAALNRVTHASEDGLDLRAYRLYPLKSGSNASLALADIALSNAVAAYAFQASGGRIAPSEVSSLIGARPTIAPAPQALDAVAHAADADHALQAFNPPQPEYLALRNGLSQVDEAERPEIIANMELWRWQPRNPGADRIVVNIPEFTARLYRNDVEILSTRVIVGKPDHQTPIFSNQMKYLIVNPVWNVPDSIIQNEMSDDPEELQRHGYKVTYADGVMHVQQPPGARNALGRIKFMFPNEYSVYLHDTPNRNLFSHDMRAFSHGCVRVEDPFKLAETLLRPENGWTQDRLKKMIGSKEQKIDLPQPLPIHIVYFTVIADAKGDFQSYDDIYGYTRQIRQLLGMTDQ